MGDSPALVPDRRVIITVDPAIITDVPIATTIPKLLDEKQQHSPSLSRDSSSTTITNLSLSTAPPSPYPSLAATDKNLPSHEYTSWISPGSVDSISSLSTTVSTLSDTSTDPLGTGPFKSTPELSMPTTRPSIIDVVTKPPTAGKHPIRKEIWWNTTMQIAIPFFLAGCGTIGAGFVLSIVQDWSVFTEIKALFILVPSLVGLKGNLDTCLASRLSTQANLGNLRDKRRVLLMVVGNIGLVQVQAIVASLLVSIFAISVSAIMEQDIQLSHALVVASSAVTAATVSCFILDLVLISVIVVSHKFKINPDNIASPFAASIGDIVSLGLLSVAASFIYKYYSEYHWIPWVILSVYAMVILPFWVWVVLNNTYVRKVLSTGWIPIISALLISGTGGIVLDHAVNIYSGFVVFQPIINGIGGNLVSIQSSRIATMLHQSTELGTLPPQSPKRFVKPWKPLFKGLPHAATARILLAISIPGHLVFIFVADFLHSGYVSITWEFTLLYLVFAVCQVLLLLYMAHVLTHVMWLRKVDPDSAAVPFLTATGDLLGTALLLVVFVCLHAMGKDYELVKP